MSCPLIYDDIINDLVRGIMRAQLEVIRRGKERSPEEVKDKYINQHFSWLAWKYPEGVNRHLYSPDLGNSYQKSLRTEYLRKKRNVPEYIQRSLKNHLSPVKAPNDDNDEGWAYVQKESTRISSLIKLSFKIISHQSTPSESYLLLSPLAIALDFLTAPNLPGSSAYALFSIRNYLFAEFNIVPHFSGLKIQESTSTFTAQDIDEAMSTTWTSLRERPDSRGMDPIPPMTKGTANGVVRAYLASKKILYLKFRKKDILKKFLEKGAKSGSILPERKGAKRIYEYEYQKSSFLKQLPDAAEINNELLGLLLPLRGMDTIFRGGLKFPHGGGLVVAIHGGAGTGKTALALALSASLRPMGVTTLFITAEEHPEDLLARIPTLLPEEMRRFSFFKDKNLAFENIKSARETDFPYYINKINIENLDGVSALDRLEGYILSLSKELKNVKIDKKEAEESGEFLIPKPCSLVVVLDGLHDVFVSMGTGHDPWLAEQEQIARLKRLIDAFKELRALVLLTAGEKWVGDARLDYLVDVSLRLSHESMNEYGAKPDRRLQLLKARHQICSPGIHGMQIAGEKGLRFSPQINYRLDERAIWKTQEPDKLREKRLFSYVADREDVYKQRGSENHKYDAGFKEEILKDAAVKIFPGSHIFINGMGSGGKAGLALKIALAPIFSKDTGGRNFPQIGEKVLIVSFLYPHEYYEDLRKEIIRLQFKEYKELKRCSVGSFSKSRIKVFQLYPGHLRPNDLFNNIEWELRAAELYGDPYTSVIIDGIHNVFLQFPAIEEYGLFWPQLYNSLRTRPITTITTHTTLTVPTHIKQIQNPDDGRSEPLRHALVQKTDFQFEVDPCDGGGDKEKGGEVEYLCPKDFFKLKTLSCIRQPIPRKHILWDREYLIFVNPREYKQKILPFD